MNNDNDLELRQAIEKVNHINSKLIVINKVKKYIWLKSIALQFINKTYGKISSKERIKLKEFGRCQSLFIDIVKDNLLIKNLYGNNAICKKDYLTFINSKWFPLHNEIVNKNTSKILFKDTIEECTFKDKCKVITEVIVDYNNVSERKILADIIELWVSENYHSNIHLNPNNFWYHPKILELKEEGLLDNLEYLIEDIIDQYNSGNDISIISSKSGFKVNFKVKSILLTILYYYNKKSI
jgi:hypothetical protein